MFATRSSTSRHSHNQWRIRLFFVVYNEGSSGHQVRHPEVGMTSRLLKETSLVQRSWTGPRPALRGTGHRSGHCSSTFALAPSPTTPWLRTSKHASSCWHKSSMVRRVTLRVAECSVICDNPSNANQGVNTVLSSPLHPEPELWLVYLPIRKVTA